MSRRAREMRRRPKETRSPSLTNRAYPPGARWPTTPRRPISSHARSSLTGPTWREAVKAARDATVSAAFLAAAAEPSISSLVPAGVKWGACLQWVTSAPAPPVADAGGGGGDG